MNTGSCAPRSRAPSPASARSRSRACAPAPACRRRASPPRARANARGRRPRSRRRDDVVFERALTRPRAAPRNPAWAAQRESACAATAVRVVCTQSASEISARERDGAPVPVRGVQCRALSPPRPARVRSPRAAVPRDPAPVPALGRELAEEPEHLALDEGPPLAHAQGIERPFGEHAQPLARGCRPARTSVGGAGGGGSRWCLASLPGVAHRVASERRSRRTSRVCARRSPARRPSGAARGRRGWSPRARRRSPTRCCCRAP